MTNISWLSSSTGELTKDDNAFPRELLKAQVTNAVVTSDGIAYPIRDLSFLHYKTALSEAIAIEDENQERLNANDKNRLVSQAISNLLQTCPDKSTISPKRLRGELSRLAKTFFASPKENWTVVTSISADKDFFPVRLLNHEITLADSTKYSAVPNMLTPSSYIYDHVEKTRYTKIAVSSAQYSKFQTYAVARSIIDSYRAIATFCSTYQQMTYRIAQKPDRIFLGRFYLSPIQMIYDSAGKVDPIYWFEPSYVGDATRISLNYLGANFSRKLHFFLHQLEISYFQKELSRILQQYINAIDQHDIHVALLSLWSVLEAITGTNGDYEKTVRLGARFSTVPDLEKEKLQQIRRARNQFVHRFQTTDASETLYFLLKAIVDRHLRVMLTNPFRARSIVEYHKYLQMPQDSRTFRAELEDVELRASHLKKAFTVNNTGRSAGRISVFSRLKLKKSNSSKSSF